MNGRILDWVFQLEGTDDGPIMRWGRFHDDLAEGNRFVLTKGPKRAGPVVIDQHH